MTCIPATSRFIRHVSVQDFAYFDLHTGPDAPQTVSQLVVEGIGHFEASVLETALAKTLDVLPILGAQCIAKGGKKAWYTGGLRPRIRSIPWEWDGHFDRSLPFAESRLDVFAGPVAEIVHILGARTFLVFRVHHAIMDGASLMQVVQYFFAALRGEALPAPEHNPIAEDLLAAGKHSTHRKTLQARAATPFGTSRPKAEIREQFSWQRVTVPGKDLLRLAKVLQALSQYSRKLMEGPVLILLPVDLRRHLSTTCAPANLVGMMYLDLPSDATVRSIVKSMNQSLSERRECPPAIAPWAISLFRWLPMAWLLALFRIGNQQQRKYDSYRCSGLVSMAGPVDVNNLSTPDFKALSCFGIPIKNFSSPVFVVVCDNMTHTEITVGARDSISAGGQLERLSRALSQALISTH